MDKEVEKIAEFAHLTWQRWMAYMLVRLKDVHSIARWKRQANTSYWDLPEPEKESDRAIALKYLEIIKELGYGKLPTPDEIKEWIGKSFSHLNPEYTPFFLMGVEALYVHLGGKKFIEMGMPK